MIIILIITVIALIVFNVWNLISLKRLKKDSQASNVQLNDDKYYELKYKNEFLVAIFTVIVAVAGFIGYGSYKDINEKISSELNPLLKRVKSTEDSLNLTSNKINSKDSIVNTILKKNETINQTYDKLENNLKVLNTKIEDINNKNIVKQNYYIISNIKYYENFEKLDKSFLFKDFLTNNGDKLPIFKTAPLVIPVNEATADIFVYNVTREGFSLTYGLSTGNTDTIKFNLVIMEK